MTLFRRFRNTNRFFLRGAQRFSRRRGVTLLGHSRCGSIRFTAEKPVSGHDLFWIGEESPTDGEADPRMKILILVFGPHGDFIRGSASPSVGIIPVWR